MWRNMHEDLQRREKIKGSSDRSFGLVIAAAFALIALLPTWHAPHQPRWWALVIGIAFATIVVLSPKSLAPLNRLWLRLGLILSAVVSPIVVGLLFYTTLLPVGLLMRASGKDPLRLRPEQADSYWIRRDPTDSASDMKRQF
jgi:predicted membrane channel-forming protein YqfA (hemolysin III family)